LLRRIDGDLQGLFLFVDIEDLAEGLEALGDDLDLDFALRNRRDPRLAILVGAQLEGGLDGLAEFDDGMALDELDDHAGAVDGFAALSLDDNVDLGHGRREGAGGEGRKQEDRHNESAKVVAPIRHIPIINGGRAGRW